jgi:hypothetical protein
VNEVASLIEKGTSITLANVLANNVLPNQIVSQGQETTQEGDRKYLSQ